MTVSGGHFSNALCCQSVIRINVLEIPFIADTMDVFPDRNWRFLYKLRKSYKYFEVEKVVSVSC